MNLETAAVISELIVDRTLTELEGCTDRLVSTTQSLHTFKLHQSAFVTVLVFTLSLCSIASDTGQN